MGSDSAPDSSERSRRALLVGLNARYTHTNLALLYLRNEIVDAGHAARIVEFETTTRRQEIVEAVVFEKPDAILFSVYIWNAALVSLLLPDLRALIPEVTIVVGGPEVSYSADAWLERHPEIDVVVVGPGEEAVRRITAEGFRRSTEPTGTIVSVPNRPFRSIRFPYTDDDLSRLSHRYVYYESSRGCPCSCSYCVSGRADQRVEFRDTATTLAELQRFIDYEPHWEAPPIVKFVDRTFNASPKRAREIWCYLLAAQTGATFHFEVHPGFLGDADFELLAGAPPGRFQFEVGIQSVHDATLHSIDRSPGAASGWSAIRANVARLIAIPAIELHLDMIVGLPGEDRDSIGRSIDEIMALRPYRFDIGFLKSLPGTGVEAAADANAQIAMHDPPYQVLSNRWMSLADFALFRRVEQLVDALWNANHLHAELDAVTDRCGGSFTALCELAEYADRVGYDLSTRRPHKVVEFVASFLESRLG